MGARSLRGHRSQKTGRSGDPGTHTDSITDSLQPCGRAPKQGHMISLTPETGYHTRSQVLVSSSGLRTVRGSRVRSKLRELPFPHSWARRVERVRVLHRPMWELGGDITAPVTRAPFSAGAFPGPDPPRMSSAQRTHVGVRHGCRAITPGV